HNREPRCESGWPAGSRAPRKRTRCSLQRHIGRLRSRAELHAPLGQGQGEPRGYSDGKGRRQEARPQAGDKEKLTSPHSSWNENGRLIASRPFFFTETF